jgi:sugar lactone lactonase YvrE
VSEPLGERTWRSQPSMKRDAYYPESPLLHDDKLYYVEYTTDRVFEIISLNYYNIYKLPDNSGPCSIIYFNKLNDFIIACYNTHKLLCMTHEHYIFNIPFPNDMCNDSKKGIFITSSSDYLYNLTDDPFDPNGKATGSIYYLSPIDTNLKKLNINKNIHYANGIIYNKSKLYVSEHFKNRILLFNVNYENNNPILFNYQIYIDLPYLENSSRFLGPDGLTMDNKENLYIAHYTSGNLLKYTNEKKLVKTYNFDLPNVTNVTIDNDNKFLYITVAAKEINNIGFIIKINI